MKHRDPWWMLALAVLGAAAVVALHTYLQWSVVYPDGFALP